LKPDPDNAGGGKTLKIENNDSPARKFNALNILEAKLNG